MQSAKPYRISKYYGKRMIESKVKNILSVVLDIDESEINNGSSPETLRAWDSLNHFNIITAIEEEFEIHFEDVQILEMQSYKLICVIVIEALECSK